LEKNPDRFIDKTNIRTVEYIQDQFDEFQKSTQQMLQYTASSLNLGEKLSRYPDVPRKTFFDLLLSNKSDRLKLEIFDKDKNTIAWAYDYGPEVDTVHLKDNLSSYIVRKPLYSYLIVSNPIKYNDIIVGYLVGKRLFDVRYPISNRFINSNAFNFTFSSLLNISAQFNFTQLDNNVKEDNIIRVPLYSLDKNLLGYAELQSITISEIIESFKDKMLFAKLILLTLAFISVVIILLKWRATNHKWLKPILIVLSLWIFRYILVWLNLPQKIFTIATFDPQYFASDFGFGIAKSLGDLFLSSIISLITVGIIFKEVVGLLINLEQRIKQTNFKKYFLIFVIIILIFLILSLLRGFAAIINSAVFDSNLEFSNATEVFPSFNLAVMLLSLLFAAITIILLNVVLIIFLKISIDKFFTSNVNRSILWAISTALLLICSILYGLFYKNTLLQQDSRIIFLLLLVALSAWVYEVNKKSLFVSSLKFSLFVIIVSFFMLMPTLKSAVQKSEYSFVEILSNKISQPIDNWLSLLVNETIDKAIEEYNKNILTNRNDDEISNLAFSTWAASPLSKEGNNCVITFFDKQYKVINTFHIGRTSLKFNALDTAIQIKSRMLTTEDKTNDGFTTRWYVGFSPIFSYDSSIVSYIQVAVTGNKEDILKGELPSILQNYVSGKSEIFQRHIFFSEYIDGEILSSTSEFIPRDKLLPREIADNQSPLKEKWITEYIEGKYYESYFFKGQDLKNADIWYSLSFEKETLSQLIYWYIKGIMFFIIVIGTVGMFLILFYNLFLGRIRFNFSHKLLISYFIVSFIPLLLLVYFNKQYALKRAHEDAVRKLSDETNIITKELQRRYNLTVPVSFNQIGDDECLALANETNIDFDLYFLSTIHATSKPEMYTAGFIDKKMNADAYLNVILKQKEFYTNTQTIGSYSYIIGCRALYADDGTVIGVVSVPSLYSDTEIDEELANRNIFLYSAYTAAIIILILLSILISRHFSSPIKRLKDAIQQIGYGDLNISLKRTRNDELGDLEEAFGEMATNLKKTQEEMLKAQREAAWREMAKQVAHEIKNPLTPIKLSIQHLRQAYQDGVDDFKEILNSITATVLDQIEILNNIATEFSHFARMPKKKIETIDVHKTIDDVIAMFNKYQRVNFRINYNAERSAIDADRQELSRSFVNIIRNSIQAMNEKGDIYIETTSSNESINIIIRDTGPGIPDEVKSRLFEPNFSTKTDGMGLGLSIVKKCVDDLNGIIGIESKAGEGTTVRITIPFK